MFWFLGPVACWILVARPGIKPALPALEGKVLTREVPDLLILDSIYWLPRIKDEYCETTDNEQEVQSRKSVIKKIQGTMRVFNKR